MVCPECGSSSIRVLDINKDYLRKSGAALLDWWAEDCFIVRRRGCKECSHSWRSVELPLLDLKEALDERASAVKSTVRSARTRLEAVLKDLGSVG
jgi:hypothetical protein